MKFFMKQVLWHCLCRSFEFLFGGLVTLKLVAPWVISGVVIYVISSLLVGHALTWWIWCLGQLGVTYLLIFGVVFYAQIVYERNRGSL